MANKGVYRNDKSDDLSLGIINMDEINVFGESSRQSSASCKSINDRLYLERIKAFETLQKTQKSDFFLKPFDVVNKENMNSMNNSPRLNHTDYVPYRRPNVINITNLITDDTINLETSACPTSVGKNTNVSFEPGEITARSTHLKHEFLKHPQQHDGARLSVSEILASSFAPKARNLRDSLLPSEPGSSAGDNAPIEGGSIATSSSSFNTYNGSRSLPRTADMSLSKDSSLEASFGAAVTSSAFPSFGGEFNNEEFVDADLMQSKLLTDEISWAQKYAAIPVATLSEQAKIKANPTSIITAKPFDTSASNSMIADDPNFSLGKFFNMRSENIWNIVPNKSPDKCREPVALVDDSVTSTTNCELESGASCSVTPKVDNKKYSLATSNTLTRDRKCDGHVSKDSGNSSDASYLLSMSAIDRALCNLDIQTDDSESGIINKFKQEARKNKCNRTHYREPPAKEAFQNAAKDLKQNVDVSKENKENLDPKFLNGDNLSKTLSFTESILNSSEMKALNQMDSISKVRSPLSPIENHIPIIKICDNDENHDADVDEWPSTPIKSPNRVHRLKSPKHFNKSPSSPVNANSPKQASPSRGAADNVPKLRSTKSLCSTRLDGEKTNLPSEFGVSPNSSKLNLSPAHLDSNKTPNNTRNNTPSLNSSRSNSPATYELSPMSSPHSCLSSHASSPSAGYRSPRLDSTTNSERRFLNAPTMQCVVSKTSSSSSVINKIGNNMGHPVHNYNSAVSLKSVSSVVGRSTSSCSNSSEFSHRDGKSIPMKVSSLELSWGSTKLRTTARKSMQVKNTAKKRLVVRVEVHGPGFQMINTQGNVLTLQSQECRSIIIDFCPTVMGIAIGILSFYSPSSTASFLDIPLYAYGGHAKIISYKFLKGPVGASFLPLGEIRELVRPLEKCFKIYNRGSLLAFTSVCIDPIGPNMPCLGDSFEIRPNRVLIAPGNTITVRIVFRPKREDVKNISKKISSVLTLANMRIISGDEGNRQRMRRLIERMSSCERSRITSSYMDMICGEFPDEVDMTELEAFKERPEVMIDLIGSMRVHEVSLTINKDSFDETADASTLSFPDADETVLFRTVCAASPSPDMLEPVDEQLEATIVAPDERAVSLTHDDKWSVRPNILEFDFDVNRRQGSASLLINNLYKSRKYFEIACNCKNLFSFTPSKGHVEPNGGQILVVVKSNCERPPSEIRNSVVMITASLENERITVPVNIPDDNFP